MRRKLFMNGNTMFKWIATAILAILFHLRIRFHKGRTLTSGQKTVFDSLVVAITPLRRPKPHHPLARGPARRRVYHVPSRGPRRPLRSRARSTRGRSSSTTRAT